MLQKTMLDHLDKNASIVILTGAGISAESGLDTFRGGGGLWCGQRVEDVATPEAFMRDPDLVHDFYNMRRENVRDPKVQPNVAHKALAELEHKWAGDVLVVTQNVDDLHERGGSKNLLHMHGEVLRIFCTHCGHKQSWHDDLSVDHRCDSCGKTGGLRPDIVWFGEMPYHMDEIIHRLSDCDLFIAIGTSGHVYPAAGFVENAAHSGAFTIECNLESSQVANAFDHHIWGPASKTVPALVNDLFKAAGL